MAGLAGRVLVAATVPICPPVCGSKASSRDAVDNGWTVRLVGTVLVFESGSGWMADDIGAFTILAPLAFATLPFS